VTVRTCKKQGVDCKPEVRHIHRRRTPIPVKDGSSVDQRLAEDEYCGFIFLMRTCVTVGAIVLLPDGVFDRFTSSSVWECDSH
jgi:hypothetical protein